MQINFLKEIVEEIAGKPATEIVDLLLGKKDVNEFLIAKKLKLTINQTRNILYKLSEAGLVSSTRKKDKRKGWFIYFWTLDVTKSLDLLEKNLSAEADRVRKQLENRNSKRFYVCKTCNTEVGEENALLSQFTCQECGQVYALSENEKFIKDLTASLSKLEKQISTIQEEKALEQEKKHAKKKRAQKSTKPKKKKKKTNPKKAISKKTTKPKKDKGKKKKSRKK